MADGQRVRAWIEPNCPAYRLRLILDHGFLCVDGLPSMPAGTAPLRFENTSEEWWMLADMVGSKVAQALWEERAKYDEKPFFMVYDHERHGRLYFQPGDRSAGEDAVVVFGTRRDGRYPNERIVIAEDCAVRQLEVLFAHAHPSLRSPMIPNSAKIEAAIVHGQKMAAAVMAARAQYEAIVQWDFESRFDVPEHQGPESNAEDIESQDDHSAAP